MSQPLILHSVENDPIVVPKRLSISPQALIGSSNPHTVQSPSSDFLNLSKNAGSLECVSNLPHGMSVTWGTVECQEDGTFISETI